MLKVAIMYDFDKTLSTTNMQEYSFLPDLGIAASDFWKEVGQQSKDGNMDPTLAYMYMMVQKAEEKGKMIRREQLAAMGKDIEYFPGVTTYFERINKRALDLGIELHHYIISSGTKEILEGCSIAKEFTGMYACQFHYNAKGNADWPAVAIDYTGKTQFLFRINKHTLDISDAKTVNKSMKEEERDIHFCNMIYIGDGGSDIPCMTLVKSNGGYSIAVYSNDETREAQQLFDDGRVNFIAEANYEDNSKLDQLLYGILKNMNSAHQLESFK